MIITYKIEDTRNLSVVSVIKIGREIDAKFCSISDFSNFIFKVLLKIKLGPFQKIVLKKKYASRRFTLFSIFLAKK